MLIDNIQHTEVDAIELSDIDWGRSTRNTLLNAKEMLKQHIAEVEWLSNHDSASTVIREIDEQHDYQEEGSLSVQDSTRLIRAAESIGVVVSPDSHRKITHEDMRYYRDIEKVSTEGMKERFQETLSHSNETIQALLKEITHSVASIKIDAECGCKVASTSGMDTVMLDDADDVTIQEALVDEVGDVTLINRLHRRVEEGYKIIQALSDSENLSETLTEVGFSSDTESRTLSDEMSTIRITDKGVSLEKIGMATSEEDTFPISNIGIEDVADITKEISDLKEITPRPLSKKTSHLSRENLLLKHRLTGAIMDSYLITSAERLADINLLCNKVISRIPKRLINR